MGTKQIIVTGDIAQDVNIYKGKRTSPEETGYGSLIKKTPGGSMLLFDLIYNLNESYEKIADSVNSSIQEKIESLKTGNQNQEESQEKIDEKIFKEEEKRWDYYEILSGFVTDTLKKIDFPESKITFGTWKRLKNKVPAKFQEIIKKEFKYEPNKELETWKVFEPLGFGTHEKDRKGLKEFYSETHNIKLNECDASILVIDDGGNYFRNNEDAWKNILYKIESGKNEETKTAIEHVILKTASPIGAGKLFQELNSRFRNKLTIVTSVDEIRKECVLVSGGISWEQTALDLIYELKFNKTLNHLLSCRNLIITFRSEGALYLEMKDEEIWKCRLIFDPEFLEGEWAKANEIKGDVIGSMTCFTASIVYGFMQKESNMESMVTAGLSSMRKYQIIGHGQDEAVPAFPFAKISNEIINPNSVFASAFVPLPNRMNCGENLPGSALEDEPDGRGNKSECKTFQNQNWTILEGNYLPDPAKKPEPLFDTAFRFALFGRKELANTPFLKFGKLLTYDRKEIEALRNIRNLIDDYIAEGKADKPLSLAVFGAPGSGKSFAVKQLAEHLKLPFLEFNLSQFVDVRELEGAFHQVRDEVLKNKVPVIFWDEFDSQAYRWLQYLLAPMQDGKFQQGQITHPIGKCIFIFAGATSFTFETFGVNYFESPDKESSPAEIIKYEANLAKEQDLILKKVPDFKSRLSGYLNVQGPNQLECLDKNGKVMVENGETVYNKDDIFYPVRRALFLRGLSGKKDDETLEIDAGLLNALIKTGKYRHGSRSMEKIVLNIRSGNQNKFRRSGLPSMSILSMLVDIKEFICLLNEDRSFEFQAFKIAPQIHQNWIKIGDTQGWKLEYHKDYNYLPAHLKDENIAAARRIPEIVGMEQLKVVKEVDQDLYKKCNFRKLTGDGKILEKLAIKEHEGWVQTKLDAGWQFDEERNDDRKLHNCIIGWDEVKKSKTGDDITLSDKDKNKDKDAIINYPGVLKAAGFVIVER